MTERLTNCTRHRTVEIDGLDIFYREAGPADAPVVLLLHGFPTSSHMFRNLIPALSDRFRLVAPDYPGFGASSMPQLGEFDYSFDNLARIIEQFTDALELNAYSLYLMDYGAPIGFRLAAARPERVQSLVIQNGNAYEEGLLDFWRPIKAYWREKTPEHEQTLRNTLLTLEATRWQYTHGLPDLACVAPDNWYHDQFLLDRPGAEDIQIELFFSYGTNPPLYPEWQRFLRDRQPPALIVWGKNDYIFPAQGAAAYKRDLEDLELHLLDAGHFVLESDGEQVAGLMRSFLERKVTRNGSQPRR